MGIFRRKKKNRIDTSEYPDDNVLKIDELFGTPHSEENKTVGIQNLILFRKELTVKKILPEIRH